MTDAVDIAILGGGCAGLSLAVNLARREGRPRRVIVLEEREEYLRDRTWCSWSVAPHAFSHCVDHRWSRWMVRADGVDRVHESSRYAYEHIRADRFYGAASEALDAARGIELRMGVQVRSVSAGPPHRVLTSEGEMAAEVVVDTRPPRRAPGGSSLLQHFVGWEVRTERHVFDPSMATLMDFDVDQEGDVHFMYVLPFASDHALVESTVLSGAPLPRETYERRIESYLDERFEAGPLTVEFRERGVIPMDPDAAVGPGLRAGELGGAIRPSSGYAFHAIQRTSEALADNLVNGRRAMPAARGPVEAWMDRVFLGYLRRHPERAPRLFSRMLKGTSADAFARFMMERGSVRDRLQVVRSMPTFGFAREALRVVLP